LSQGERIRELELSRSFNTSQGPVREALKCLEQEGLVKRIPHKGTFVSQITREEVEEIYVLRALVEGIAVKRFLRRVTEEDITTLQGYVEAMRRAAGEGDVSVLVEQDMLFHQYICRGSGSKILLQIWSIIHGKARLASAAADRLRRDNLNEIAEMHQPLLDSIASGEMDRALEFIKIHIQYLWDQIPREFWNHLSQENKDAKHARPREADEGSGDWDIVAAVASIFGTGPGVRK